MPTLLIVSHTPSPNTQRLTEAVARGAHHPDIEGIEVLVRTPFDADADDVLRADGVILGTTENFGYMSGALKDFFERIYYPCLEKTQGRPCALFVRAGNDGRGAVSSVERIITGLKWRQVQPPLVMTGNFQEGFVAQCEELGMSLSAGLEAGVY